MPEPLRVCVLGAGVIGLHAAVRLQRDFPAARITVITAAQGRDITSHGAAGIFRPGFFRAASPQMTREIIDESWQYYRGVLNSKEAAAAGVIELAGYFYTRGDPEMVENTHLRRLCPDYRVATERELSICPGGWKHGIFCTTMLADNSYQLDWLTKKFTDAGGKLVEQHVKNFSELKDFDIIVNCTGLGAQQLTGDTKLIPVRGQVFKVKAPWIKTFFYGDFSAYIIPCVDTVTLGGVRQLKDHSMEVSPYDSRSIWEKCTALVPSLRRAEVIKEWVGLRPLRDPVRLEKERLDSGVVVVHSYGHGGYGVMTAPGTAGQVSRLVAEITRGNFTNPVVSNL